MEEITLRDAKREEVEDSQPATAASARIRSCGKDHEMDRRTRILRDRDEFRDRKKKSRALPGEHNALLMPIRAIHGSVEFIVYTVTGHVNIIVNGYNQVGSDDQQVNWVLLALKLFFVLQINFQITYSAEI